MTKSRLGVLVCALALVAAACKSGGGGGGTTTSQTPATTPTPGGTTTPTPGGTTTGTPTVDATVATISLGAYAAANGIQGVALNADRSRLYVGVGTRTSSFANGTCQGFPPQGTPVQGMVAVVDTNSRAKIADVSLPAGTPVHVELDTASGRMFVPTSPQGLFAIEGTSVVLSSTQLGGVPHDIGIDPGLRRGVVTNTFDQSARFVSMVDLNTLAVTGTIDTGGTGPHKAAVDPERHLAYITHAEYSKIDVIDMQTGRLARQIDPGISSGGAQNAIDLTRRRLFTIGQNGTGANTSRLVAIDLTTERPTGTLQLPDGGHGTRVDPVTGLVWVGLDSQHQVAVVDPVTLTEKARIPVGHCPYYLDIDPVRRLAYVTNQGDTTVTVVDMTRVPTGALAVTAMSRARQLESWPGRVSDRQVQTMTDETVNALAPITVPGDHSIRERIARAQANYLNGRAEGVSEAMVADAINGGAAAVLGAAGMEVTPADVHAHRRALRGTGPSSSTEMSPLEAVTVALSLIDEQLTDPSNGIPVWTSYRFALEASLKDEGSVTSWLAHRWLNAMGLRR